MREFLRFSFKSREGLLSYLAMFGSCLLGLFLIHLLLLGILKYDGDSGITEIVIYEWAGAVCAGVSLAVTGGRMLRIAVNGGTSRKSYLYGMGIVSLVFSVISAAAIQLVYIITDLIFECFGMELDYFTHIFMVIHADYSKKINLLSPKIIFFNMIVILLLVLLAYTAALIYMGLKNRVGKKTGLAAAGLLGFTYLISYAYYDIGVFRNIFAWLQYILYNIDDSILASDPAFKEYLIEPEFSYLEAVGIFVSVGLGFFAAAYLIYFLLARRAPVRGRA